MSELKCLDCGEAAKWVRCTQFAGDHPYCQVHAEQQADFMNDGGSYYFWTNRDKSGIEL